jgi:hypothetical protein
VGALRIHPEKERFHAGISDSHALASRV